MFKRILYFLRDKWVRKTSLTIILSAVLIAIFLLINIIAIRLDVTPWDFTQEKRHSLSEESKEVIRNVKQNVTIYFFGFEEDSNYVSLAKQYEDVNDKIRVKSVSFIDNPSLASSLGITVNDTIIAFQSSQRNKLVSQSDLITYDLSTYEQIDVSEQKFTNAIIDVTITRKPQIYFLEGNGEFTIDKDGYMNTLSLNIVNEVNDVKRLDLLTTDVPEDCDVIVVANPTQDFTSIETDKIINYIHNGGNILWLQNPYGYVGKTKDSFPNISRVLAEYGFNFSESLVCETNSSYMLSGNPDCIMPVLTYNDIVKDLYTDGKVVLTDPGKIDFVSDEELANLGVSKDNFMVTTDGAYYNTDIKGSIEKESTDETGTFVLGTALKKKIDDNKSSKMVAISSAFFVSDITVQVSNASYVAIALRNNKDIALNAIAYLSNKDDSLRIRKNTNLVTFAQVSQTENAVVSIIIFGFPLLLIIVGITVIIVRKHKR